jgi:hypothetical protein
MKPNKLMDTITRLGAALEKDAGQSLVVCSTNSLGYALFREQGMQVLPDESHEVDTGGGCLLIVTNRAAVMSGLILRMKGVVEAEVSPTVYAQFCVKLAVLLRGKRDGKAKGWEEGAMKDAVSLALDYFSKNSVGAKKAQPRKKVDPFTGQSAELPAELPDKLPQGDGGAWGDELPLGYWTHAKRTLRNAMQVQEGPSKGESESAPAIIVCGVAGSIVGRLWLPLVDRTVKLTPGLVRRIVARLIRLKYDPSYAQAILQEMLARSKPLRHR